jgi:hypothetical protein
MNLCAPALIYLAFSFTQIIIDTFKGFYNTALMKFVVMIMITLLLNALCQQGLSVISWFIVFIPFIFMTFIVSILLYIFGLDAATGKLKISCNNSENTEDQYYNEKEAGVSYLGQIDQTGNIIFINPSTSSTTTSTTSSTSSTTTDNSDVTTSPNFYIPPIFNTNNVVKASSIPGFDSLV